MSLVAFLLAAPYERSQRGCAWLFLITAHAIKSHRVVASLKSSGARICKPFVKAGARHSWCLSRVISGTMPRGEGRDAWQFLLWRASVCFLSVYREIFYAHTLLLYSPHVRFVFRTWMTCHICGVWCALWLHNTSVHINYCSEITRPLCIIYPVICKFLIT